MFDLKAMWLCTEDKYQKACHRSITYGLSCMSVLTVSLSPGLQDAVLLFWAVNQGVWVGVKHMALDVVQVKRGQFSPAHHAQQPASLRLILHQELLAEPGMQWVVQVAFKRPCRRSREVRLLLLGVGSFTLLRVGTRSKGLLWLLQGSHSVQGFCWRSGEETISI